MVPEYGVTKENDGSFIAEWPDGMTYEIPTDLRPQPKAAAKIPPVWTGERDGAKLEVKWTRKHDTEWLTLWSTKDKKLTQVCALSNYTTKDEGAAFMIKLAEMWQGGAEDKAVLEAEKFKHGYGRKTKKVASKRPAAEPAAALLKKPSASDVAGDSAGPVDGKPPTAAPTAAPTANDSTAKDSKKGIEYFRPDAGRDTDRPQAMTNVADSRIPAMPSIPAFPDMDDLYT